MERITSYAAAHACSGKSFITCLGHGATGTTPRLTMITLRSAMHERFTHSFEQIKKLFA